MAWRRNLERTRLEAPSWYRAFDLAMWDEPDPEEQAMMRGCSGYRCWPHDPPSRWPDWPQWLHEHHARRRWRQAQYRYGQEHPAFASQEFEDLQTRHRDRHSSR